MRSRCSWSAIAAGSLGCQRTLTTDCGARRPPSRRRTTRRRPPRTWRRRRCAELGREHDGRRGERADEHGRKCHQTPQETLHFAPAPPVPRGGGQRCTLGRLAEPRKDRVEQAAGAEPHRVVGRKAGLGLGRLRWLRAPPRRRARAC